MSAFYSIRFWQFFFIMVLSNWFGTFFSYAYKPYGEGDGTKKFPHDQISDSLLTWASSIGAGVINGGSRVVFGWLVDKYNFRSLMLILMTMQLVNACVCFWCAYVPALFFTCVLVNYVGVGGIFAIFPVSVTNVFGLERCSQIYVQILFGSFVSSLLNLVVTEWALPATNNNWGVFFYLGALF